MNKSILTFHKTDKLKVNDSLTSYLMNIQYYPNSFKIKGKKINKINYVFSDIENNICLFDTMDMTSTSNVLYIVPLGTFNKDRYDLGIMIKDKIIVILWDNRYYYEDVILNDLNDDFSQAVVNRLGQIYMSPKLLESIFYNAENFRLIQTEGKAFN